MNLATRIENAVAYIRSRTSAEPSFGMILGSGLGDFADTLENRQVIPKSDIPPRRIRHTGDKIHRLTPSASFRATDLARFR